ncbi:MAG: sensor histidine kinase [Clostridia bacterium]
MDFKLFFKEKAITILLLLFGIITIEIFLMAYNVGMFIKIYIPLIIMGLYMISIIIEYFKRKKFYDNLLKMLEELDEKYLITEIIKTPNFLEGQIFKNSLEQIDKSMLENVNKYKYMTEDYKEYIELWIHEIKIPIATSKMVIENNKNAITKSIDEELDKVENYIEQALFYARSNTVEKDYYIRKVVLKEIVNESIKKNKSSLIQEKISIDIHDLEIEVNTDNKWIVFILNQIIQNSIKYRKKENSVIEIYANQGKENVILYIKDNGIGIKQGEITRVFEKGFTGTNGRLSNKKSTGIGLYLCKKLCNKLGIGIGIELNSVQNEGTEVKLVFPKDSYIELK